MHVFELHTFIFFFSFTINLSLCLEVQNSVTKNGSWATADEQRIEMNALLKQKESFFNHPSLSSWENFSNETFTSHPCVSFNFVKCKFNYVTDIVIDGNELYNLNASWNTFKLEGTVDWDSLSQLKYLSRLEFGSNAIYGDSLPSALYNFSNLKHINIEFNKINQSFPQSIAIMENLEKIHLNNNQITGELSPDLANLKSLNSLILNHNQLRGSFPDWIQNLTSLTTLLLHSNRFTGSLPDTFSNYSKLKILNLNANGFYGTIPKSLSKLQSMSSLSLNQNSFSDVFPPYIHSFSNLTLLDVSNNGFYGNISNAFSNLNSTVLTSIFINSNYFNGTVPSLSKFPNIKFLYSGNCFLNVNSSDLVQKSEYDCIKFYENLYPKNNSNSSLFPPLKKKKKALSSLFLAIIISLSFFFIIFIISSIIIYRYLTKPVSIIDKSTREIVRAFNNKEIQKATKNFSQILGKGGYGTVYKAEMPDGQIVAVKRLHSEGRHADSDFRREVELLSRLHHRHLVTLLGFCYSKGERMLVFEYLSLGSLYDHLHGSMSQQRLLSWDSRTKIAIHVALGLEYLHFDVNPPLIHRDIKSANILLGDDGFAKISDFGLCKAAPLELGQIENVIPTATAIKGSFGYLDPEYVKTSILSEKSDVYSFGVVLLELITGHKSIHNFQPLAHWAEEYMRDREKTPLMVDPSLEGNYDLNELFVLSDVALSCLQDMGALRPSMRGIIKVLVENLGEYIDENDGNNENDNENNENNDENNHDNDENDGNSDSNLLSNSEDVRTVGYFFPKSSSVTIRDENEDCNSVSYNEESIKLDVSSFFPFSLHIPNHENASVAATENKNSL